MEKKNKNILQTISSILSKYSYIFVTVIIFAVYAYVVGLNGRTFNWGHISGIFGSQNTCIVGVMALGMAMVIITGGIDLSLGANLVLATGVGVMTYNVTYSIPLTIIACIIAGALGGLINGLLIGYIKMPPFIATLGTQLIYRSVMLYVVRIIDPNLTGSSSSQFMIKSDSPYYEFLKFNIGNGKINLGAIDFPIITLIMIMMVALFIVITTKTKFGKKVYAVGSNEKSAKLAGINVEFTKMMVYVLTGALVGVSSFLQICKVGSVTPASSGVSYEMYAVIACVLGGINMSGGRGNLLGVAFGAVSYSAVSMIIVTIPGLTVDIQNAFQGLVLITVILIQLVGPMIKEKSRQIKKKKESAALQG